MILGAVEDGGRYVRLQPGQSFGMNGLLSGAAYGFTICANSDVVKTLSISYEEMLASCGSDAATVGRALQTNLRMHWLRQLDNLAVLNDEDLQQFLCHTTERHFNANEVVFSEGDRLDDFYILEKGQVVETTHQNVSTSSADIAEPGTILPSALFGAYKAHGVSSRPPYNKQTLTARTYCALLRVPIALLFEQQVT